VRGLIEVSGADDPDDPKAVPLRRRLRALLDEDGSEAVDPGEIE
jgi:hypothetical protein